MFWYSKQKKAAIVTLFLWPILNGLALAADGIDIPVPHNTIFAGQQIEEAMLRGRWVPSRYLSANPVLSEVDQIVGKVAKQTLRSGQPIMTFQVEEPDVVKVSQSTVMKYETNGLTISTEVIPLNSAKSGEIVRVRNRLSRQIVVGRALESGIIVAVEQ